jgi:ATP-dependent Lon protease
MSDINTNYSIFNKLLLPNSLKAELEEATRVSFQRELDACATARKEATLIENLKRRTVDVSQSLAPDHESTWPARPSGHSLKVFDRCDIDAYIDQIKSSNPDEDSMRRAKELVKFLYKKGEYRKFGVPGRDWKKRLSLLEKRFPLFSEVIHYVRRALAVADLDRSAAVFSPILLVGNPGVGKSYFANELAHFLSVPISIIPANTMQSNATLSGSAAFWSNSMPGKIFRSLVYEDYANPIIILDEIEKIGTGLQYDPCASFYQIFEEKSARRFFDLCFDWLPLNASRITYVCTANSTNSIPEPILSRLKVFNISDPTPAQNAQIIHHIFREMKTELPYPLWHMCLDDDVISSLQTRSPRTVKNLLRDAAGNAVLQGRKKKILLRDLNGSVTETVPVRTIGFL